MVAVKKSFIKVITLSLFTFALSKVHGVEIKANALVEQAQASLVQLADDYLAGKLSRNPMSAYYDDIALTRHDKIIDNSLAALQSWHKEEDAYLARLKNINRALLKDTPYAVLYAQIQEDLEGYIGERVCRIELWNISHMYGLHLELNDLSEFQPLGSELARKEALARWQMVSQYYRNEIDNLKLGLKLGYSAAKPVVVRYIKQIDNLINAPKTSSPLYKLALGDSEFNKAYAVLIQTQLLPTLIEYRRYLKEDYLPLARENRSLAANPNGQACYQALYRSHTSLKWSPEKVHQLGVKTVEGYKKNVISLGKQLYQLDDFALILAKNSKDPQNYFASVDEMSNYFVATKERIFKAMEQVFSTLPAIKLDIKAYPDYLVGSGLSPRYEGGSAKRNAVFRYDPASLPTQTRGGAEIVTAHEGYPGHHMHIASIQEQPKTHDIQKTFANSAYFEGWARYAENLVEELGLYETHAAKIERRAWAARGMVVDTGLHVFNWSLDETKKVLVESGKYQGEEAIRLLDRMATIPAQLTSYDSGALEIFALRELAQEQLQERFDLKKFHSAILKNGAVPFWLLREQVEDWIKKEQKG